MSERPFAEMFMRGAMYAPFVRTLDPPVAEIDRDLRQARELGMNCIRAFAAWHRLEPREGRYDFAGLDRIMDAAGRHGLGVMLTVGCHYGFSKYVPRWFLRAYRGEYIKDAHGVNFLAGGMYGPGFPCPDDPEHQAAARRYVTALAERYRGHPALAVWNACNEPMGPECHCRHTVAAFQRWLVERYGSLAALNVAWGSEGPSDYDDWAEVVPPGGYAAHQGSFRAWCDWTEYRADRLAAYVALVASWLREADADHQVTANALLGCPLAGDLVVDPWKINRCLEVAGSSNYGAPGIANPMRMDLLRAGAGDKPAMVEETQAGPTIFLRNSHLQDEVAAAYLVFKLWESVAHGMRGFMVWCYRARMSDTEGGDLGLVRVDGSLTERARALASAWQVIAADESRWLALLPAGGAGILFDPQAGMLAVANRTEEAGKKYWTGAVRGAYRMLWANHWAARFVHPDELGAGTAAVCPALLVPLAFATDADLAGRLEAYMAAGGEVVFDGPLGIWDRSSGLVHGQRPGALAELLRLRIGDVLPDRETIVSDSAGTICAGPFQSEVEPDDGLEILGRYQPSGRPALVRGRVGRGGFLYTAGALFNVNADAWDAGTAGVLTDHLKDRAKLRSPPLRWEGDSGIRVHWLAGEGGEALILLNYGESPAVGRLVGDGLPWFRQVWPVAAPAIPATGIRLDAGGAMVIVR